jgi:hypothetical protein
MLRLEPDNVTVMFRLALGTLLALFLPAVCSAQEAFEAVGGRALGMAGAFVAVADDATAVYWNPAGLAKGPKVGMIVSWLDVHTGPQDGPPVPGPTQRSSKFISLGTLPLGLSYGNYRDNALVAQPLGGTRLETLATRQYGATILQSVTPGVVLGSTLKWVRGTATYGPANQASISDAFGDAGELEGPTSNHFDLDIGAMIDMSAVRLGVTMRNALQPEFRDPAGAIVMLKRQARAGLAFVPGGGLTLAMDVDLNTAVLPDGPRRVLAFGGEEQLGSHFAVRAGIRRNLAGIHQVVTALGASVSVKRGLWVDSHYTRGRDLNGDREVGVSLRAGF